MSLSASSKSSNFRGLSNTLSAPCHKKYSMSAWSALPVNPIIRPR